MRWMFRVRFKIDGKPKTFRTKAKSPNQAAQKLKSHGRVISVTKESRAD